MQNFCLRTIHSTHSKYFELQGLRKVPKIGWLKVDKRTVNLYFLLLYFSNLLTEHVPPCSYGPDLNIVLLDWNWIRAILLSKWALLKLAWQILNILPCPILILLSIRFDSGGTFSSIFQLFYIEIPKLFKIEGNRSKYIHIFDQNKSCYFRVKCFYF